jgi:DNA-directed RNA polymerase sigma subunit (sigma70/sigma32)
VRLIRANCSAKARADHQSGLDELYLYAICRHILLGSPGSYTCAEIGRAMGISHWAVHLIEQRALRKLRFYSRRLKPEVD